MNIPDQPAPAGTPPLVCPKPEPDEGEQMPDNGTPHDDDSTFDDGVGYD